MTDDGIPSEVAGEFKTPKPRRQFAIMVDGCCVGEIISATTDGRMASEVLPYGVVDLADEPVAADFAISFTRTVEGEGVRKFLDDTTGLADARRELLNTDSDLKRIEAHVRNALGLDADGKLGE